VTYSSHRIHPSRYQQYLPLERVQQSTSTTVEQSVSQQTTEPQEFLEEVIEETVVREIEEFETSPQPDTLSDLYSKSTTDRAPIDHLVPFFDLSQDPQRSPTRPSPQRTFGVFDSPPTTPLLPRLFISTTPPSTEVRHISDLCRLILF
jgi:hypothetical protein